MTQQVKFINNKMIYSIVTISNARGLWFNVDLLNVILILLYLTESIKYFISLFP